jgi:hypothetical protein
VLLWLIHRVYYSKKLEAETAGQRARIIRIPASPPRSPRSAPVAPPSDPDAARAARAAVFEKQAEEARAAAKEKARLKAQAEAEAAEAEAASQRILKHGAVGNRTAAVPAGSTQRTSAKAGKPLEGDALAAARKSAACARRSLLQHLAPADVGEGGEESSALVEINVTLADWQGHTSASGRFHSGFHTVGDLLDFVQCELRGGMVGRQLCTNLPKRLVATWRDYADLRSCAVERDFAALLERAEARILARVEAHSAAARAAGTAAAAAAEEEGKEALPLLERPLSVLALPRRATLLLRPLDDAEAFVEGPAYEPTLAERRENVGDTDFANPRLRPLATADLSRRRKAVAAARLPAEPPALAFDETVRAHAQMQDSTTGGGMAVAPADWAYSITIRSVARGTHVHTSAARRFSARDRLQAVLDYVQSTVPGGMAGKQLCFMPNGISRTTLASWRDYDLRNCQCDADFDALVESLADDAKTAGDQWMGGLMAGNDEFDHFLGAAMSAAASGGAGNSRRAVVPPARRFLGLLGLPARMTLLLVPLDTAAAASSSSSVDIDDEDDASSPLLPASDAALVRYPVLLVKKQAVTEVQAEETSAGQTAAAPAAAGSASRSESAASPTAPVSRSSAVGGLSDSEKASRRRAIALARMPTEPPASSAPNTTGTLTSEPNIVTIVIRCVDTTGEVRIVRRFRQSDSLRDLMDVCHVNMPSRGAGGMWGRSINTIVPRSTLGSYKDYDLFGLSDAAEFDEAAANAEAEVKQRADLPAPADDELVDDESSKPLALRSLRSFGLKVRVMLLLRPLEGDPVR